MKRLTFAGFLVIGFSGVSGCAQHLMAIPEEFGGDVDVYPVSGRQGILLFNPAISFGPYRTVSLHRGFAVSEHSSVPSGVLTSEQHDSSRQAFDYALQGPTPGVWRGRCLAHSEQRSRTEVTGAHFGTDGSGLTSEQTRISESSGYDCKLDGPGGEHWTLEADEGLGSGTVKDDAGQVIVDILPTGQRWSWKQPALEGNTLEDAKGVMWAAVQRTFAGGVYLSRKLQPKDQVAVAAVCVALLIPGQ